MIAPENFNWDSNVTHYEDKDVSQIWISGNNSVKLNTFIVLIHNCSFHTTIFVFTFDFLAIQICSMTLIKKTLTSWCKRNAVHQYEVIISKHVNWVKNLNRNFAAYSDWNPFWKFLNNFHFLQFCFSLVN